MKNPSKTLRSLLAIAFLTSTTSVLAQEVTLNPNGFPSGPHYNLNIIGKKADYNCTPVVYENGVPVYGNVIFVPETGLTKNAGQIVIKSGKKGGKATMSWSTDLQVVDACSPAFDGDPAEVLLPPNENGYYVYARALAKPGGESTISYGGSLFSVIDEYGNDLVYLGLVTSYGVALPDQDLVRNKGKSVAVDITGMFLWSGTVSTIVFPGSGEEVTGTAQLCWIDADFNGALSTGDIFSPSSDVSGASCSTELCWADLNSSGTVNFGDTLSRPLADGTCAAGTKTSVAGVVQSVPVHTTTYENYWIFNIGDLVSSDWLVDNQGMKLIQLRFYPR